MTAIFLLWYSAAPPFCQVAKSLADWVSTDGWFAAILSAFPKEVGISVMQTKNTYASSALELRGQSLKEGRLGFFVFLQTHTLLPIPQTH